MSTTEPGDATPVIQQGGLIAKLAEVIEEVEGVEKRGRNPHFKYDYATAEDTLRAIRGPLAKRKVVVLPSLLDSRREGTLTIIRLKFTFIDGETGEREVCEWEGTGDDKADKGHPKAYTIAIRTFLRESFLLPSGDDPEADGDTDKRAEQARKPAAVVPPPAPTGPVIDTVRAADLLDAFKERNLTVRQIKGILAAAGVPGAANLPSRDAIESAVAQLTEPQARKVDTFFVPETLDAA